MAFSDDDTRSGGTFLIAAGLVYEVIAAACSSPQTAEINAGKRAPTLMKWVYIGMGQAALFVLAAAIIDTDHRAEILVGGTLAGGIMYAQYVHALRVGQRNADAPTTESY